MSAQTRGRLLVATPPLEDPNFDRTVVYMLEHASVGAVGVVLTRPGQAELSGDELNNGILRPWLTALAPPRCLFFGGPVGDDSIIAIAEGQGASADTWGDIGVRLGTVDLSVAPTIATTELDRVRLFRGYAGWGPLQLDDEIDAGGWMVFDADNDDVFTDSPSELWRTVVRRQGGSMTWIAEAPPDISAN